MDGITLKWYSAAFKAKDGKLVPFQSASVPLYDLQKEKAYHIQLCDLQISKFPKSVRVVRTHMVNNRVYRTEKWKGTAADFEQGWNEIIGQLIEEAKAFAASLDASAQKPKSRLGVLDTIDPYQF